MKTVGKAGVFLSLVLLLALWAVVAVSQQGAVGGSDQTPVRKGEQGDQDGGQLSREAAGRGGSTDLTFVSPVRLPIVLSAFCTPSAPGDSDNIIDALTVCSGQTVSGQVNGDDWDDVYQIWTVANQHLTISMNGTGVGGPGDADLYLYPPSTRDIYADPYADSSTYDGNSEYLARTVLAGGYWYINVYDCCDGDGGTNYNLTVTLSGPGAAGGEVFDLPPRYRLRDRSRSSGPD